MHFNFIRAIYNFNSRPSARGDNARKSGIVMPQDFNSRPSARGDENGHEKERKKKIFQFTPLREGRRAMRGDSGTPDDISIHAPPRGATTASDSSSAGIPFQFTPLREGRRGSIRRPFIKLSYFNSRPSARGDKIARGNVLAYQISIHAPPRGATVYALPIAIAL